jgi:hypothetical protein
MSQRAHGMPEILDGVLKPQQGTFIAVRLLCLFYAAISALGGQQRFLRRHALADKIICNEDKMGCNFARKLLFGAMVAEKVPQFRQYSSQAQHGQGSSTGGFSTVFTWESSENHLH